MIGSNAAHVEARSYGSALAAQPAQINAAACRQPECVVAGPINRSNRSAFQFCECGIGSHLLAVKNKNAFVGCTDQQARITVGKQTDYFARLRCIAGPDKPRARFFYSLDAP